MSESAKSSPIRERLKYEIESDLELDFSYENRIRQIETRLSKIESLEYIIAGAVFFVLFLASFETPGALWTSSVIAFLTGLYLHRRFSRERRDYGQYLPVLRQKLDAQRKFLSDLKKAGY